MNNLVFLPVGIAFLGFSLTLIVSRRSQKLASLAVAVCYVGFGVWSMFNLSRDVTLRLNVGGWPSPFGISLMYDNLTALLISLTGILYLATVLYSKPGKTSEDSPLFFPLIHILICGISGAFTTGDLFNLYVWFEVILLSSFVLLSLGNKVARIAGAFKYVVLNMLSSFFFLAAAGLVYNAAHTLNLVQLASNLGELALVSPNYVLSLNILLFIAFAIKSALFPFFFWLPASYHTLSPAISALFAGLLTKVGLYAIFRVNLFTFPQNDYVQALLGGLACASILIGVAGAIVQTSIRRILGFHIISQVGYIALAGIFAFSSDSTLQRFGISVALFYMAHHILVKANLYLVSGLVASITGTERLGKVTGLLATHAFLALLFAIPALSLAGIPPFSGFWAKLGLFQAALSANQILVIVVMLAGGFFTVFSMTKIWLSAFWGEAQWDGNARPQRAPVCSVIACILLSMLSVAIGLHPDLLFGRAELAARDLISGIHHVAP
ncbi:MAG: Na+/H+ antiporter subunit D [Bdellovibrionaceae bacterium]|nr:hypothetical protein [Bdellovibrionales bacterium]MCB9255051.1 Na+/H+ antiporter subunit D [Pseudobdellovibrionaceae bacterium]